MPKIKPLTEHEAEVKRLRANLEIVQGKRTNEEMGKLIGRSGVTYAQRLKDPEQFTMREIRMICNYFKLNRADFIMNELKISCSAKNG